MFNDWRSTNTIEINSLIRWLPSRNWCSGYYCWDYLERSFGINNRKKGLILRVSKKIFIWFLSKETKTCYYSISHTVFVLIVFFFNKELIVIVLIYIISTKNLFPFSIFSLFVCIIQSFLFLFFILENIFYFFLSYSIGSFSKQFYFIVCVYLPLLFYLNTSFTLYNILLQFKIKNKCIKLKEYERSSNKIFFNFKYQLLRFCIMFSIKMVIQKQMY